jgi:Protein of unknown function (DUF3349)
MVLHARERSSPRGAEVNSGRRLTEDEVREIAADIAAVEGDRAEIGVHITRITDAVPAPDDVARVEDRLTGHPGWPIT